MCPLRVAFLSFLVCILFVFFLPCCLIRPLVCSVCNTLVQGFRIWAVCAKPVNLHFNVVTYSFRAVVCITIRNSAVKLSALKIKFILFVHLNVWFVGFCVTPLEGPFSSCRWTAGLTTAVCLSFVLDILRTSVSFIHKQKAYSGGDWVPCWWDLSSSGIPFTHW